MPQNPRERTIMSLQILTAADFIAQGTSPWAVVSMAVYHEQRAEGIFALAAKDMAAPRWADNHLAIAAKLRNAAFQMDPATRRRLFQGKAA